MLGAKRGLFHWGIKVTGRSGVANFFFVKIYFFFFAFLRISYTITPKKKKKKNRIGYLHYGATLLLCYDQNPLCFSIHISIWKSQRGLNSSSANLHKKEKRWRILLKVVKWRGHRANALLKIDLNHNRHNNIGRLMFFLAIMMS